MNPATTSASVDRTCPKAADRTVRKRYDVLVKFQHAREMNLGVRIELVIVLPPAVMSAFCFKGNSRVRGCPETQGDEIDSCASEPCSSGHAFARLVSRAGSNPPTTIRAAIDLRTYVGHPPQVAAVLFTVSGHSCKRFQGTQASITIREFMFR